MKYRAQIISLTSLLDLMFIMIFAMQLKTFDNGSKKVAKKAREVREKAQAVAAGRKIIDEQRRQLAALDREAKRLSGEKKRLEGELSERQKQLLAVKKKLDKSEAEKLEMTLRFEEFLKSVSTAAGISTADLKAMLKDLPPEEQKKLMERVAQSSGGSPSQRFMKLKQMESVQKILTFWHIMLTDTDDVAVTAGTVKDSFSCLSEGPDPAFSEEVFIRKFTRFVEDRVGEPAKSSVLITYGYSPRSTKIAVDNLGQAVRKLVESLNTRWKTKKFYISDVKLIPDWQRKQRGTP